MLFRSNLGTKELADGLSYVAISRVNSIANLGHYGIGMDRLTAEIRKRKGIYVRLLGEKQMCHEALATAESCSNSPDMQPHMGYIRQTIRSCETWVIQALAAIDEFSVRNSDPGSGNGRGRGGSGRGADGVSGSGTVRGGRGACRGVGEIGRAHV